MKVAIDLTALLPQPSGVDKYLLQFVRHLGQIDAENQYTIFLNYEDRRVLHGQLPANFRPRPWCFRPRAGRLLFQQVALPAACASMDADVVHSPSFLMPYWRGKQRHLLTVHDLSFFSMPEVHSALHRSHIFRRALLGSILRAHLIQVPSESTRRDLLARVPQVPPERVRVIPYGVDACFHAAPADQVRREVRRLELPDAYILFVGNIEPRKNLPLLVESYVQLVADGAISEHLVIAGKRRWGAERILRRLNRPELRGRVHLPGYVSREDLPWVYRGARLFVYPSLFEGFGFPPLEAMACGVPTIATQSSSLEENLRGAAELVPPGDAAALTAAMRRLLCDEDLREQRKKMGLERAAAFRWEQTAREILDCYRQLAATR
jgi:glycosyltransferase involved in cell wall biosynthesis